MAGNGFGLGSLLIALALSAVPAGAAIEAAKPAMTRCSTSTSAVQQLATIEKPGEDSFQCLGLSLDGAAITAIRLETHRRAAVEVTEFPLAVLQSRRGAVLDGVPGHDAIILQGNLAAPVERAQLVTSYLYNGITGEYRSCPITLDRAPDVGWRLVNSRAQTISRIVVRTRDLLIIPFGIATLEGACAGRDP